VWGGVGVGITVKVVALFWVLSVKRFRDKLLNIC